MSESKGIGEGGKTLKQMMEENERLYRETGCYAGITEPHLLKEDPVKSELFHSRIMASLMAGREITRMISASPFVREVAELCLGFYTADGASIAQSTGIQAHIMPMGESIQWMIKQNYEQDVGINEGDLFIANDPVIAGMHPADVYDILPIFWEGELVGWVCTVIMEMDIGAVSPGCMPTANAERGSDGLRFCCEKWGANDLLRRDFELKIELSLDMADMFLLNRKGAIAANIRVREEVKNIIREFGLDYYKRATRELIEEERRNQLARVRQRTVPGRYRDVVPVELDMAKQPISWLPANQDTIRLIPIQFDILPSGRLVLDFEGTGEWGWHPFNGTPTGLRGCFSTVLTQTISYDGRSNLGTLLACEIKEPAVDSLLNPSEIKRLATADPWAAIFDLFGLWQSMLGIAHYLRGFREETFNWRSSAGWQMAGYDALGTKRPLLAAETGQFGPGATGVGDGCDCGGWIATQLVDMGNAEVWELFVPMLEMTRRLEPYSTGYGKFRSGVALASVMLLHRITQTVASGAIGTASDGIIPNLGQFGGYPGGKRNTLLVRYDNLQELIENRQPLLHELGHPAEWKDRIKGQVTNLGLIPPTIPVYDGDVLVSDSTSAGGLGDPIEREPRRIKADLDDGFATDWMARNIYCVDVIFNEMTEEWQINEAATSKLREAKRKERLSRGVPVKQWWQKSRQRLMERNLDGKILEMYQSSMRLSEAFTQEFKDFWALPDDFNL